MKLYPRSVKCKKPKLNSTKKGATWDYCKIIDAEGKEQDGWLETSWGQYVYFQARGEKYLTSEWRKVKHELFDTTENVFDFRKLSGSMPSQELMKSLEILLKE
jgi:hypothetical protein